MLAAIMVMMLLAIISIAVLTSAGASRRRAIRHTRAEVRENCAYAGLNYARNFFGNNFANWNTYFSTPTVYNPMRQNGAVGALATAVGYDPYNTTARATAKAGNPNLFVDLDSDGNDDVILFIRDNYDEYPPLPQVPANYNVDNDQNAIIGALCISTTMQPRNEDGTVNTDGLLVESLLQVNQQQGGYAQRGGGT
ncbi:MAG: hypothetical protein JNM17_16605 [Archangium sp.]|nr:hypothetical protein [Archangium sp.]